MRPSATLEAGGVGAVGVILIAQEVRRFRVEWLIGLDEYDHGQIGMWPSVGRPDEVAYRHERVVGQA